MNIVKFKLDVDIPEGDLVDIYRSEIGDITISDLTNLSVEEKGQIYTGLSLYFRESVKKLVNHYIDKKVSDKTNEYRAQLTQSADELISPVGINEITL